MSATNPDDPAPVASGWRGQLALGFLLLGVGSAAVFLRNAAPREAPNVATIPHPPAMKVILPEAAYSTPKLGASTHLRGGNPEIYRQDLVEVLSTATRLGLSSAFLVRGRNLREVIRATSRVLGYSYNASEIVPGCRHGDEPEGDAWVCAYFGSTGSSPPYFRFERVEVEGSTVRVLYAKELVGGHTQDVVPYLIWANIGPLPSGTYQVELVDVGRKPASVVTSRKVVVPDDER